jgi:hypothetical protein
MYCKGNVSLSNDWNGGLQEVLDSDPVIILIIFYCNWKTLLLYVELPQKYNAIRHFVAIY